MKKKSQPSQLKSKAPAQASSKAAARQESIPEVIAPPAPPAPPPSKVVAKKAPVSSKAKSGATTPKKSRSEHPVVRLTLELDQASTVFVAGTFNDWNPAQHPMRKKDDTCCWFCELTLPAGSYEYLFVVDGRWMGDPAANQQVPNPFGGMNSVLSVA
jgi:1,4-alpha-glucan branching enzyme